MFGVITGQRANFCRKRNSNSEPFFTPKKVRLVRVDAGCMRLEEERAGCRRVGGERAGWGDGSLEAIPCKATLQVS